MQDPDKDISHVVALLTTSAHPGAHKAAVERFFTSDAGLKHPLCVVTRGPNSRCEILGAYQWYRILSPRAVVEVKEIVYNRRKNVLFLEVVQRFRVRWSPFPPIPARSIVRLDLEERDGLHYIVLEEDLFHPVDVAALVIPPLKPFVSLALRASNFVHYIGAGIAQNVGVWKPEPVRTIVTA